MKSEEKIKGLILLKYLSVTIIIIIITLQFKKDAISKAPFKEVENSCIKYADLEKMQEGEGQMLRRLYGLNPNMFVEFKLMYPKSNMDVEEFLLIKLKDNSEGEEVKKAIQKRVDNQKKNFDGYGTYQYEMIQKSIIEVKGNYVLFVSGSDSKKVVSKFKSAL